jgi:phosphate transport system permease protein
MHSPAPSVRSQMAAAKQRIGRLKRIDRAAVFVITMGGIAVVIAVLGILVFVAAEALPLFKSAKLFPAGDVPFAVDLPADGGAEMRALGIDEYKKYVYAVESSGRVAFHRYDTGELATAIPVPSIGTATVTSSSRTVTGHYLAAGLSDGRVSLMQVRYVPQYEGEVLKDLTMELVDRGALVFDATGQPVRQVTYLEQDEQKFVAALTATGDVSFWWTGSDAAENRASLKVDAPDRITHLRLGRNGSLLAGTDHGRVYHWVLSPELRRADVSQVSSQAITALEWMLGGNSWVAGAADGSLTGWLNAPTGGANDSAMVKTHTFHPQAAPIVAMALSARERSFATIGRDGAIALRHQTSERLLAVLPSTGPPAGVLITPKADGLLTLGNGALHRFVLDNPHPETSWKTLFGKVWYEGYGKPEYVWQSTAATDDVETKFSLVPLIFGTIKGTLYAILFAVPLAVFAALYTSQFMDPAFRSVVKPTVEIMAALPSVVIGFLAGLYLASVVEKNLVAVLVMLPLLPIAGTAGIFIWRMLPRTMVGGLRAGSELILIVPLLLAAISVALATGPTLESWWFGGDARLWINEALGLTYDQRNCLVVGIAMGFAVIPIIFTISEDAFSGVPASLTAASLALGASRWQTASRVVLPTASPGIFSAIMVGFGRAVGETMIVLMATGNTPVMDWSIFNGIRTLSANIAVEIPEAPHASTLYRTLFLAAALLFIMTFFINTLAEVIRQRLRERYRAV